MLTVMDAASASADTATRRIETAPAPTGDFDTDLLRLGELLDQERGALDGLPSAADRNPTEATAAGRLRGAGLTLRQTFVRLHANALYQRLTDDRRLSPRLNELAAAAAELLPGLVPTAEELTQERKRIQVHKEGREAELGVLFWGFLRSPDSGRHLQHTMLQPTARAVAALPDFKATGFADLGVATVRRDQGIGEVTLRNSAYLNAEDDEAVEALETAVDLALLDDGIAVGVLRGAEMTHPRYAGRRVFSAGINLTHLYHGQISLLDFLLRRELGYISKFYRGLAGPQQFDGEWEPSVEKPWVGAVDTFAIGGGTQITLVLDHVVAEQDSYFSLPALQEGIIPGVSNLRLPRVAGARLARQAIFADRRIAAGSEAGRLLCDETAPPERMDATVAAAANRLANPAVIANRRMVHLGEEPVDTFRGYMAGYALEQSRRLYSADLIANLERTWIARNPRRESR
jgi:thioesterase DpgC